MVALFSRIAVIHKEADIVQRHNITTAGDVFPTNYNPNKQTMKMTACREKRHDFSFQPRTISPDTLYMV